MTNPISNTLQSLFLLLATTTTSSVWGCPYAGHRQSPIKKLIVDGHLNNNNNLDADEQCEFFLKSFIFALGDEWKEVPSLLKVRGLGCGPRPSLRARTAQR